MLEKLNELIEIYIEDCECITRKEVEELRLFNQKAIIISNSILWDNSSESLKEYIRFIAGITTSN